MNSCPQARRLVRPSLGDGESLGEGGRRTMMFNPTEALRNE